MIGEVFYEPSTAAHSKERKRSPKEFILTGFPHHDNPQAGTKDSYTNPPSAGRSGSVLTCLIIFFQSVANSMNRSNFDGSIQRAQPPAQEVNVIVEISILHFAGGPPDIAQNYFAVQCPAGISEKIF